MVIKRHFKTLTATAPGLNTGSQFKRLSGMH